MSKNLYKLDAMQRMLCIDYLLMRGEATIQDMIDFIAAQPGQYDKAAKRTIQFDIENMRSGPYGFNAPIITRPSGGGYYVYLYSEEGYSIRKVLSNWEPVKKRG